ncbi:hypothetical protein ABT391_16345 [Streptomyces jumonjinensis]|uniref:hypothetical protein n=2 Tax=Streptomyces jumonjinensis TaxID=1945 RepID=UPI00331EABF6
MALRLFPRPRPARRRRPARIAVITLLVSVLTGSWTTAAHAAPAVDIVCRIDGQAVLSPGLTLNPTPQNFTISGTQELSLCLDLSGNDTGGGTLQFTGEGEGSCLTASARIDGTIVWDGAPVPPTSTVRFTVALAPLGQSAVISNARVTSGLFAGDTIVYTVANVASNLPSCLTPTGNTAFGITGTVEFVHL